VKQFKLFESFKEHVEEKMKRSTAVMAIQPEKKIPSPEMFVGKLNGTTKKQKEDDWKTKMKNQQKQREKYEKMMRR
jgi:hypothetical protein